MNKISMWLDDVRPAPEGWVHVTTVHEAIALIKAGKVARASLDHDLGLCSPCQRGVQDVTDLSGTRNVRTPRNCQCMTGYKLCLWMAENEKWPDEKPVVHSANPVGAFAMRAIIDRYFKDPSPEHVCGLSGYNPMIDPACPGCEPRMQEA